MYKRILPLLIAVWMLTACAAGSPPIAAPRAIPPASFIEPPPPLPEPASGHLDDLEANHIVTADLYHRLRKQHLGLIRWLVTQGVIDD